jgi:hypothetical protein
MKYHLVTLFLVALLITAAGCANKGDTGSDPSNTISKTPTMTKTPVPAKTTAVKTTKTVITKNQTTVPTPVVTIQANLTEGFWCRDTTVNIGKAPTEVTECYQFFDDGTYKWGYSPGKAMGKSASCSQAPSEPCRYSLNANGKYEVEGGYSYKLVGVNLIDPHDPPYFVWTTTGIP